jgi:hypothetical protein
MPLTGNPARALELADYGFCLRTENAVYVQLGIRRVVAVQQGLKLFDLVAPIGDVQRAGWVWWHRFPLLSPRRSPVD